MKKNFIRILFTCLLFALVNNAYAKVMTSEIKDAHLIDDTKMQNFDSDSLKSAKELKKELKEKSKRNKEALKERQKEERETLKQTQKDERENFKNASKQAKENIVNSKKASKENAKLLKEQKKLDKKQAKIDAKNAQEKAKEDLKTAKEKAKEDLKLAQKQEEERHEAEKQRLKEVKKRIKNPKKEEITANPTSEEAKNAQETANQLKEANKIQQNSLDDIFGDTSTSATEASIQRKIQKVKKEPVVLPVETKNEVVEVSNNKKEDTKEITAELVEKTAKEDVKETEKTENEQIDPSVYKKNLTYEDIDKNAVSINDFLQFTDEQNEKFSVYYYKTTSKLTAYNKAIENKEKEQAEIKTSNLSTEEQLVKLKKLKKETDNLYKLRDDFYNESLSKFNSMLNKKQKTKWVILQEMGYRFLPEIN